MPGRGLSWCAGRDCARTLAWAAAGEGCEQVELGFGSCAMLIIKTCETFVSLLALPFWMAAHRLARLQHSAVRAAPGAAVLGT